MENKPFGTLKKIFSKKQISGFLLFILVTILALSFIHSPGTSDVSLWLRWTDFFIEKGIPEAYENGKFLTVNYPPLAYVILLNVRKLGNYFELSNFLALKTSIFLILVLTSLTFTAWTKNWINGMLLMLALILNTTALGYLDVYYALPLIISLWSLSKNKVAWFIFWYVIACSIKWQPVIIVPFLLVYLFKKYKTSWKDQILTKQAKWILAATVSIIIYQIAHFGLPQIISAFRLAGDHWGLSANGLNIGWIIKSSPIITENLVNWKIIAVTQKISFLLIWLFLLLRYYKKENKEYITCIQYCLLAFLTYFTISAGVHENHLFIAVILAAIIYIHKKLSAAEFGFIAIFNSINLFLFYGITGKGSIILYPTTIDIKTLVAITGVIFYIYLFSNLIKDPNKHT